MVHTTEEQLSLFEHNNVAEDGLPDKVISLKELYNVYKNAQIDHECTKLWMSLSYRSPIMPAFVFMNAIDRYVKEFKK
jgi:hypothetical protein